jgi:hypothetical protein
MDQRVKTMFADRESSDRDALFKAVFGLFEMTEKPVDWAYEVWDDMLAELMHRDGHKRSFAAQMLARLAISDPEGRMLKDFSKVAAVMRDEKTVTARHTLQTLWRIGLAGPRQKDMTLEALETRFRECEGEKNATLVRTDAITALGKLARVTGDE